MACCGGEGYVPAPCRALVRAPRRTIGLPLHARVLAGACEATPVRSPATRPRSAEYNKERAAFRAAQPSARVLILGALPAPGPRRSPQSSATRELLPCARGASAAQRSGRCGLTWHARAGGRAGGLAGRPGRGGQDHDHQAAAAAAQRPHRREIIPVCALAQHPRAMRAAPVFLVRPAPTERGHARRPILRYNAFSCIRLVLENVRTRQVALSSPEARDAATVIDGTVVRSKPRSRLVRAADSQPRAGRSVDRPAAGNRRTHSGPPAIVANDARAGLTSCAARRRCGRTRSCGSWWRRAAHSTSPTRPNCAARGGAAVAERTSVSSPRAGCVSLFENVQRIFHPDYVPTFDDALRARRPTSGVQEICLRTEAKAEVAASTIM
jgi:hypothetical protein